MTGFDENDDLGERVEGVEFAVQVGKHALAGAALKCSVLVISDDVTLQAGQATGKSEGESMTADWAADRGEVARARTPRPGLAKANPTRFVRGECLACGHVGIVNRRMLFERVLHCSKCGAAGLPRIVERGG